MEDMTSNRRPTPLGGRTPRKNPSSSIPKARKLPSPVGKEGKQQVKKQKEQIYEHSSEGMSTILWAGFFGSSTFCHFHLFTIR